MYLFLPPLALYLAKYPKYRPLSMWIGLVLSTLGLVAAGFAHEVSLQPFTVFDFRDLYGKAE